MDTHYHLVVGSTTAKLSAAMQQHLDAALAYVATNRARAGESARRNERWTLIDPDQLRR